MILSVSSIQTCIGDWIVVGVVIAATLALLIWLGLSLLRENREEKERTKLQNNVRYLEREEREWLREHVDLCNEGRRVHLFPTIYYW